MALIWTESCQRIRSGIYDRVYSFVNGGGYGWSATGGRNNGPVVTGGQFTIYPLDPAPSGNTFIGGIRFNPGSGDYPLLMAGWNFTASNPQPNDTGRQIALFKTAIGGLSLRNGNGVTLASSPGGLIAPGTLYAVSLKCEIDSSAGTTLVLLDGVEVPSLTLSGINTDPAGSGAWNCVNFGMGQVGGNWCDVYVLDGTNPSGDDPHDIIPDARVDYVGPDGNGYVSDFVGSDADSTDNYLLVDENTPDDDSTYLELDTAGKDAYTLGAAPVSGGTIFGVTTFAHARKTDAGVAIMKTGLRLSATDYMQPDSHALPVTYREHRHHWGANPDGGAWSESDVNAAELVLEKV